MYRKAKGAPFVLPLELQRLPFNLKRTALYPRDPKLTGEAIAQFQRNMSGEALPTYLPQRMAFQQNKTIDGERRPWWSSARSWHDMAKQFVHGVPSRLVRVLPTYPSYPMVEAASARGAAALPQPSVTPAPVISRGVRTDGATSRFFGRRGPPPSALAEQFVALGMHARIRQAETRGEAVASARAAAIRARRHLR
jgi:hypothetical protein